MLYTVLKAIVSLLGLGAVLTGGPALAWERVLLDTDKAAENWQITSQDLGLKPNKPFSVRMRVLHGGRQEGVIITRDRPRILPVFGQARHDTFCPGGALTPRENQKRFRSEGDLLIKARSDLVPVPFMIIGLGSRPSRFCPDSSGCRDRSPA